MTIDAHDSKLPSSAEESGAAKPLAPGLYIVATPIGNLEDITLRALRVLRNVDRIACEDTRQTQKLLSHFDIAVPTVSCHVHNERQRAGELIAELQNGARIALVSDAGMPGISDPGEYLVAAAVAGEIPVIPIPGASAVVSALAASGLDTTSFLFVGFPPPRTGERRSFFEALRTERATLIFYEAPHRVVESLRDAIQIFGSERRAVLAREITKIHEEFLRGTLQELEAICAGRELLRGEMTLLVTGASAADATAAGTTAEGDLRGAMAVYLEQGLDEQAALKRVARDRGVSKSEVYREWQRESGRRK
ncbi:MAG TPA: 16S rRNA (cytidine(1402)-2'-O)-methyltransferase [Acidobacteriaceae bacterium]|nr:16S rRNA (cytidine(1402)-2'-O)-methyltransferase [Acidobacteriaceae bacterium]